MTKKALAILLSFFILPTIVLNHSVVYIRLAECQNNDFYVIESSQRIQDIIHSQETKKDAKQIEVFSVNNKLKHISTRQNGSNNKTNQKRQVRCRKWIYSYKIREKTHLRKSVSSQNQVNDKIPRLIQQNLRKVNLQNTNLDGYIVQNKAQGSVGEGDDGSEQKQQALQEATVFMQINMVFNRILY